MLYTQRIDVLVENRRMNDVFLFLAQGVPLLDEHLRTPRALLSGNIGERKRERKREGWNKSMESNVEKR